VRHATTRSTANSFQRAVALDVLSSVLGMPLDLDGAKFKVGPRTAVASAERAVALDCLDGLEREFQADDAAMTGSFEHLLVLYARCCVGSSRSGRSFPGDRTGLGERGECARGEH